MLSLSGSFIPRWQPQRELGAGGQGKVYLVVEAPPHEAQIMEELISGIGLASSTMRNHHVEGASKLRSSLRSLLPYLANEQHGALKVLHDADQSRDGQRAVERALREIATMSLNMHPNLLRLRDHSTEDLWYVSEYYPGGTLDQHLGEYAGKFMQALRAIRPIVEAVAELHKKGFVHRDIKPENIFIAGDGSLVLGDFGLILVNEPETTRLSGTIGNVGSRDWMPAWAMSKRVDELRPAFDVFSLGKVVWSLTSGLPVLPLWYFSDPENDVEALFPGNPHMKLANSLFAKCIVEREANCLPDATALLSEIDGLLAHLNLGVSLAETPKRTCRVCHLGQYTLVDRHRERNFGLSPGGKFVVRLLSCESCGHVQLFFFDSTSPPTLWKDGDPFPISSGQGL